MASARAPVVKVIQSDPKVDSRYFDRISACANDDQIVDRTTTSRRSRSALSASIDDAIRIVPIFASPNVFLGGGRDPVERSSESFIGRRRHLQSTVRAALCGTRRNRPGRPPEPDGPTTTGFAGAD